MLKMEIVLDEEILDKEQRDTIYAFIDKLFANTNIEKIEQGVYVGEENDDDEVSGDLFDFLTVMGVLSEADWFRGYAKVWNWYEFDTVENLLETFEIG